MGIFNKDYKLELKSDHRVMTIKNRDCPKCKSKLVILPPDRVWCISDKCDYAEMHLIGNGTYNLLQEELNV